ncbi:MAG: UvrD-helicase domain-containing protein [Eubacteriales bacterium]|nr:UvrD-helicase domain-containing protein [Eubacteriales bacterium]
MPFTPAQQSAIDATNPTLLVSAAAGSGKTAVLVERIFHMVAKRGYSIDRMLVVTFTRAAAAEMRERLTTRMSAEAGGDKRLRRQADLIETAQIGTIHGFCASVLREFFNVVDLDPQAAICDETQRANLFAEALEETLDWLYEQAADDQGALALTTKYEAKEIADMLPQLYHFLMSLPHPFDTLEKQARHRYTLEEDSPLTEGLLKDGRLLLACAADAAREALSLCDDPLFPAGYADTARADAQPILDAQAAQTLPELLARAKLISFGRLPSLRNLSPEEAALRDRFKAIREDMKALTAELLTLLPADPEQAMADLAAMQPALLGLTKAVRELHRRFAERKAERVLIDFSDLEQLTLEALSHPEVRAQLADRYDAVFVDEYQDVSGIQEAILNALGRKEERCGSDNAATDAELPAAKPLAEAAVQPASTSSAIESGSAASAAIVSRETIQAAAKPLAEAAVQPASISSAIESGSAASAAIVPRETLRFFVGDVKQSIYRFRMAEPGLFLEKLNRFSADEDARERKISLNRNFRSRETVLDSVNRVFERVMRPDVTELDYDDDARLYPGLPSAGDMPTTLHVLGQAGLRAADRPREEALIIAREIKARVGLPTPGRDGRPEGVRHWRDFAVLLPVARGVSAIVEKTLTEEGVPVYCEDGRSGMLSEEIGQALCHLRLMNNLENDVALIAALRGPAYGLSEPELAAVRLHRPEKGASFLAALREAARAEGMLGARCRGALDTLEHERFLLAHTPLDEYLWGWTQRSGLYAWYGAQPGGRLRQANLRMLCHKASEHTQKRGGALEDFLGTVEATAGVTDGQSPTVLSPWEDVVRVMTIHKSKGLEFPVTFVMGLGDRMHKAAGTGALTVHPLLGAGLRYVNETARVKRPTILQAEMAQRRRAEEKAERARVLYVAMTRARDELILLGGGANAESWLHGGGGARSIWQAGCLMEWVCSCVTPEDELIRADEAAAPDAAHQRGDNAHADQKSTIPPWNTTEKPSLSTVSTSFPQKHATWRIVFHNEAAQPGESPLDSPDLASERLNALYAAALRMPDPGEPFAQPLALPHEPFKIGVTALCRAQTEEARQAAVRTEPPATLFDLLDHALPHETADPKAPVPPALSAPLPPDDLSLGQPDAEPVVVKRVPLPVSGPRPFADLPRLPRFMRPPEELTGAARGTATHRALSLVDFAALRAVSPEELPRAVHAQLDALAAAGRVSREERALVNERSIAQFFASPLGQRALAAPEARREWSFNLRVPDRETLAQGVIDLCFLENGAWTLVDYKTDRVSSAAELAALYGPQVALYRRALQLGTRHPVGECVLYALSRGESVRC